MMQKYLETKEEYKDCILFYRLGDFYEMFFDDAITASKELEITLTGKACGLKERAPMCGIPFHSAEGYLNKLVSKGYKVAICEQVEDPKQAKGLVKREVIRVVTPGTNTCLQALDEGKNNYLMSIVYLSDSFGIAACDVTTGDFFVTELERDKNLMDEIVKFEPAEIVCNEAFHVSGVELKEYVTKNRVSLSDLDSWYFDDDTVEHVLTEHFHVKKLEALGLTDYPVGCVAAGALLSYLRETQKNSLSHITAIHPYANNKFLIVDGSSRRNLELVETMRDKSKMGSLLWVLDKTKTAMGARMLRTFVEQPLVEKDKINERLNCIAELNQHLILRDELREYLNPIYDLERLICKVTYQSANPRDLIAFKNSIGMIPPIKILLQELKSVLIQEMDGEMDDLGDLYQLIDEAILDEPPIATRDGGIIKSGYLPEIDRLREAKTKGKDWLAKLEAQEREKTGIKNLKVKFNKVFGYYLEVTNSYLDMVPDYYTRKQTLTNAERFITPELKELEDTILGSEERLINIEYNLFSEIREKIALEVKRIHSTAKAIASLDAFCSLAFVAEQNDYVRPKINTHGVIDIKEGRHPVVEKMMSNHLFVANDTYLDNKKKRISIITGPNMAGKSTYMRQTALIVLMAQMGSFVPAGSADIGIVDRIFTRVGASDDLASGQSTFMLEMTEVANILRNATADSLLILDEIGRGTSTFDGLSIAWAVVEHISDPKILGAKALFATHYHELTELEGRLENVNNYCIAVKENGDDIVFLRKIVPGGADKSYGIQVAKLAGVPQSVIDRAKEIVEQLVDNDVAVHSANISKKETSKNVKKKDDLELLQISLFDTVKDDDIVESIAQLDISNMTPMDALNKLNELQSKIKNRW
ncbi:MAG: DNA mismatch repair protein MutS [Lachnospiraceae bacterium]|nr:DNA mismatch repair protein MutS [Lachnospiraceae bacterium]